MAQIKHTNKTILFPYRAVKQEEMKVVVPWSCDDQHIDQLLQHYFKVFTGFEICKGPHPWPKHTIPISTNGLLQAKGSLQSSFWEEKH